MDELPKDVARVLADARLGYRPPEGTRNRVLARVLAGAAGAAVATTSATGGTATLGPASVAPKAAAGISLALKVSGTFVIGAAVAGGAYALSRANTPPPPPHTGAPAAGSAAEKPTPAAPTPATAPLADEPQSPPAAAPASAAALERPATRAGSEPHGPSVAAELVLIREASRALQSGDPAAALAALSRHRTEFPRGVLGLERRALEVFALCRAGRVAEARRARAAYLDAAGDTPMAARVRATCAEGEEP